MKRQYTSLLLGLFLMLSGTLSAQTVSFEAAKAKATAFLANGAKNLPAKSGMQRQVPPVQNVELAYTSEKDGKTCFYVFNNGNDGGFVIVGGNKASKEILAYVPQGHFDYDNAPDNFKWWISKYENVVNASAQTTNSDTNNGNYHDIPDLIKTKWNQGNPYNSVIQSISGEDYPTGCVATAIAQIMKFWNYPTTGTGSHTDESFPSFSADFENTTYDWNNMLDSYDSEYNQAQADAVGTLMFHVGVAMDLSYSEYGTSGFTWVSEDVVHNGIEALVNYFNYDNGLTIIGRDTYTVNEWKNLLYDELLAGRPIYYEGQIKSGDYYVGHAFVCHGYSADLDMFSFNWGWGGIDDGYFSIDATEHFLENPIDKWVENITIGIQPSNYPETSDVQYGDTFSTGNITYMVNSPSQHTVSIISAENSVESVIVPEIIQYKEENYTVNRIAKQAFSNCFNLNHIDLPNTLLSLGYRAFANCFQLTEITIPEGVEILGEQTFLSCANMESVTLPSTLIQMDYAIFESCNALRSIVIPDNITEVWQGVFLGCYKLESVTLPKNMRSIQHLFDECCSLYDIVSNASTPPEYTYPISSDNIVKEKIAYNQEKCTLWVPSSSIESYKSADGWKDFGEIKALETRGEVSLSEPFTLDGLIYKQIPNGVEVIGREQLDETLNIPSTITYNGKTYNVVSIGARAFEDNYNNKSIIIPEGITEIKEGAFSGCENLEAISIPESVERIGRDAFRSTGIKELVISGNNNLVLMQYSFGNCRSLKSVFIGKCRSLYFAFPECTSLKTVYLGDVCDLHSFYECDSLSEIVLSNKIKLFEEWGPLSQLKRMVSFADATSAEDLPTYYEDTQYQEPYIHDAYPFSNDQADGILYVPEASIDTYKNSDAWKYWGNILPIVPLMGISIEEDNYNFEVGKQDTLVVIASPSNATVTDCEWYSSDPSVVSVDQNGIITAIHEGTVTITATSMYYPDISDSCTVVVTDEDSGITTCMSEVVCNAAIYNIHGQRVSKETGQKGLFFQNGQKFIVK